jgi:hypothetical protein
VTRSEYLDRTNVWLVLLALTMAEVNDQLRADRFPWIGVLAASCVISLVMTCAQYFGKEAR